ncbi:MAG: MoxR-like ATPase [Thermoplasmata archaeon]|nr:MoxR-like ATPase [Thermoplasmata archaeon]
MTPTPTPASRTQQEPRMDARRQMQGLVDEVAKVIVGKRRVLELVAICSVTEGAHILFEDLPGLGKSVLAASFARASGTVFKRVQFTPDLLPSDITGTYVLDQKEGKFNFHEGPIFTNFLLADEINRASPKTQSALLEAMAEKQVTVEGTTHRLPKPFMVMATQNPIEQEGTYPLPEAQLDRFMIKTSVGQPNLEEETEILNRRNTRGKDDFDVAPIMAPQQLVAIQRFIEQVHMDPALTKYIAQIIIGTRKHPDVQAGASPRGSLALMKLAKSQAALRGRSFVVPDDIRELVEPVLAHRVLLKPEPRIRGVTTNDVLRGILRDIPVPKVQQ